MPKNKTTKTLFLVLVILALSACGGRLYTSAGVSIEGVKPLIGGNPKNLDPDNVDEMAKAEQIEDIDAVIIEIFDKTTAPTAEAEAKVIRAVCQLEDAKGKGLSQGSTETRTCYRDELQNLIMSRSESRCGRYLQHLRAQSSDIHFTLGIASITAAALATVLDHARTAQKFAGISAATAGVRAEYYQSYFNQLLIQTIEGGISSKRREIREEIEKKVQGDIDKYGMNEAVKDARRYHASCNIIAGLKEASAIDLSIGLKKFRETNAELRKERNLMLEHIREQVKAIKQQVDNLQNNNEEQ